MSTLDRYVRHIKRLGPEGVLELAQDELAEQEYAKLLRRVARKPDAEVVRCEGPGCFVVFEPRRKGLRFHRAACRQRAKRVRAGGSYRFRASS